ncbi:hypothetical protein [Streptomyces nitrosporeus]|uniref:hypothetical protein n=1 Tax=Streptomyces nitrosporeus TaxID=28894 RepID=UPI0039A0F481
MSIEHAYFGRLEIGTLRDTDVIRQRTAQFEGEKVDIRLWAGPPAEPDTGKLDESAVRLTDLAALDATARAALRE